jgi:hypothetical protein
MSAVRRSRRECGAEGGVDRVGPVMDAGEGNIGLRVGGVCEEQRQLADLPGDDALPRYERRS